MSYTKTNWQTDDTITAEKLNNAEQGIYQNANDIEDLSADTNELKSGLSCAIEGGYNAYDTLQLRGNNSAVTSNGDGTYTVGTSDYGMSLFGSATLLKAGVYFLFGVPQGCSFLSTTNSHNGAIFTNDGSDPKMIVLESDTTLYLGFRVAQKPNTSFAIRPFLYNTKMEENAKDIEALKSGLFKYTKINLYTNLMQQTVTSNGITFTTNGNSIVLNGTSGNDYPRFVLCDSHYSLLYDLTAGKSYWFDVGLKDKTKVNCIYINLSFYLSDRTRTTEVGIKGPTKITVPINAVGFYMILMTQKEGLVIDNNIIVSPGIYTVNPMAESRILEQAVSASENVISINGNYASYKDFNLYGVYLNRVTGSDELKSTWRSGYIPIPFAGKYQIFQTYGMFGNTYLNVPLYDKNKRFIKSITGVDSAFRNIIEVTISESDLYDDMVYYIGLSYEPSASPDGIPMFMYNTDYPSNQRFIEPKYSVYKPYQPPMISIIDDDGKSGFLTKLLPIIESKNIPIASAVITSYADNKQDGFMTWDEIVDANNRGAEFVSHSDTHLFSPTSIEDAQMNYMRSFNKLRVHGVINDRNILVYAGASAANRNALAGARQIADGAIISSGNSMNYRGDIDPWMIKRYRIDADYQYNLDSMKELIDDCKSNGGWMIWMIHCSANEWDEYNAGTSFPQAIDYAIQNGVQIATINHAFKTYVD